jgi:hypothetical protein
MRDTIDMAREVKMPYDFVTGVPINLEKLKAFEALIRADERNALTKESDKLRNRIAYLLRPPIVVAVGCFLIAYILGFK